MEDKRTRGARGDVKVFRTLHDEFRHGSLVATTALFLILYFWRRRSFKFFPLKYQKTGLSPLLALRYRPRGLGRVSLAEKLAEF